MLINCVTDETDSDYEATPVKHPRVECLPSLDISAAHSAQSQNSSRSAVARKGIETNLMKTQANSTVATNGHVDLMKGPSSADVRVENGDTEANENGVNGDDDFPATQDSSGR